MLRVFFRRRLRLFVMLLRRSRSGLGPSRWSWSWPGFRSGSGGPSFRASLRVGLRNWPLRRWPCGWPIRFRSNRLRPGLRSWPYGLRPVLWSGFGPGLRPCLRPHFRFDFRPCFRSHFGFGLHRRACVMIEDRANDWSWLDASVCLDWLCSHKHRWPSMIDCSELSAIAGCGPCQFNLSSHRRSMRSAVGSYFGWIRTPADALRSSVVADAIVFDSPVDDDVPFVNIGDVNVADVIDGTVVSEVVAMPVAALIADTDVPEAVIDAAVKADIAAPVAVIEAVAASNEAPVARSPESAFIRRCGPCSRNPVIAGRGVAPIARCP